jgi:hypothetical protein
MAINGDFVDDIGGDLADAPTGHWGLDIVLDIQIHSIIDRILNGIGDIPPDPTLVQEAVDAALAQRGAFLPSAEELTAARERFIARRAK